MNVQEVKQPIFSLRFRLILMVTAELVASVLLALWVSNLLDRFLPADLEIPFLLYLVAASLFGWHLGHQCPVADVLCSH